MLGTTVLIPTALVPQMGGGKWEGKYQAKPLQCFDTIESALPSAGDDIDCLLDGVQRELWPSPNYSSKCCPGELEVVILVPTRELALQTSQVCKELAKHLKMQVMVTMDGVGCEINIFSMCALRSDGREDAQLKERRAIGRSPQRALACRTPSSGMPLKMRKEQLTIGRSAQGVLGDRKSRLKSAGCEDARLKGDLSPLELRMCKERWAIGHPAQDALSNRMPRSKSAGGRTPS
ncbi:hypothetical protein Cgig2_015804 [Carnegiea gigantea]|uniref:DEAD/DEAH box helicase domain-containing protein n=1 Tax=Carnegiea gigantea TaxID=171969 RepID=A0A9Q1QI12_9CARY|nr:hypothetical protein Cgig2_015804 [Carnegiea gigantea]